MALLNALLDMEPFPLINDRSVFGPVARTGRELRPNFPRYSPLRLRELMIYIRRFRARGNHEATGHHLLWARFIEQ